MLSDVVEVQPRGEYRLWVRFEDGVEGEVDLGSALTFEGVFAPLRDPAYFSLVRVNPELGTICWPNDADWDPLVLYSLVTKRPVESPAPDLPHTGGHARPRRGQRRAVRPLRCGAGPSRVGDRPAPRHQQRSRRQSRGGGSPCGGGARW